jgi:cephalosporin-C deacetylase-like acetyl esterase
MLCIAISTQGLTPPLRIFFLSGVIMLSRLLLACSVTALLASPLTAADTAKKPDTQPGDEMIDKYLAAETARLSRRFLDGAKTRAEWEARLPRLHREYLDMLGLWPMPEKTPLHATVTGTLERGDVVIEKLHFQSRPHLYVSCNLYRPKKITGKLPAVLYVCGHSGRGRDGNKTAFQDHGMWFASNGYVCLIVDTLQLGEVKGVHHGTYNRGRWWWQARGYTPAGVECWNGIRAIDYLLSRPEVDRDRLAVTGISGGGAATFWIAAADDRVKCAVPVSGMSDLESYVAQKVINGHCDCMFLYNTYQWNWTTIAALVAPRPLLFCNSDHDTIFPMDGNERIIERLRKLYKMYGKPELVDAHVSHGGHDYRPDLRIAVFKWINKHVKNDTGPIKDADFKELPGQELRVFPEDKDLPKDAINGNVDEVFVPRAEVKLPEAVGFTAWKADLLLALRERSFRAFPERIAAASGGEFGPALLGMSYEQKLPTEPGVELVLLAPREPHRGQARAGSLLVLNPEEEVAYYPAWAKPLLSGKQVQVLHPRGGGRRGWTQKSPPNYVKRAHALLGLTVDEGRVRDIAATIRYLDNGAKGKVRWRVIGRGQAGILAAHAALFEPSIAEVVVVDPPVSHRDGPIFLNVLRVLDIPDALGLLAPRPLTLVNAKDKAFDRTVQIYRAAGAEKKLTRK